MVLTPEAQLLVLRTVNPLVKASEQKAALRFTPRRAEFTLQDIAVGTQLVEVSWVNPIRGDFAVVVLPTSAAQFVGLLHGAVQAGSKTTTGCTVIVANRSAQVIGVATFDVLAFPL